MPTRAEIHLNYQRQLLSLAHGFPFYTNPPKFNKYPTFSQRGFSIGDVVHINANEPGLTEYLLNVFEDREQPIQINTLPPDFRPAKTPDIVDQDDYFAPDTWLLSHTIDKDPPSSPDVIHEFTCSSTNGAFVGFPFGARRRDVVNPDYLRPYIQKHAKDWYAMAANMSNTWDSIENGYLFLITGVDSTTESCCSSYIRESSVKEERLQLTANSKSFVLWIAKPGRLFHVKPPVAKSNRPPITATVFVRGFTIAIGPQDWEDLHTKWSHSLTCPPVLPQKTVLYRLAAWASRLSLPNEVWVPPLELYRPELFPKFPYHPSMTILQRLIPGIPAGGVAIVHDDEWRSVIANMNPEEAHRLISGDWNVCAERILSHYCVIFDKGLISLKLRTYTNIQGILESIVRIILRVASWF